MTRTVTAVQATNNVTGVVQFPNTPSRIQLRWVSIHFILLLAFGISGVGIGLVFSNSYNFLLYYAVHDFNLRDISDTLLAVSGRLVSLPNLKARSNGPGA